MPAAVNPQPYQLILYIIHTNTHCCLLGELQYTTFTVHIHVFEPQFFPFLITAQGVGRGVWSIMKPNASVNHSNEYGPVI